MITDSFGRGHLGVSAWHSRPLCQTIVVTAGCGWERRWGRPVEEIRRVMRSGSRPHCVEGWTALAEPSAVLGTQSPNIESITSYLKTVLVFHA